MLYCMSFSAGGGQSTGRTAISHQCHLLVMVVVIMMVAMVMFCSGDGDAWWSWPSRYVTMFVVSNDDDASDDDVHMMMSYGQTVTRLS